MSNANTRARGRRADPKRESEIDLVLAVMCSLVLPGQCVPYHVIAELTGMSHGGAFMIEKSALKKLRQRMSFTTHGFLGKELS